MPFELYNRRYTGSKLKISEWICDLIRKNCHGDSFTDLFAGTAIMAYRMLPFCKKINLNDKLYSNKIIYEAFFDKVKYSRKKLEALKSKYRNLNPYKISKNYISESFGNKYFSRNDAKMIGFIREDIEKNRKQLNKREYNILVASLLYSADRCANTVGHYDAYIKRKMFKKFEFDLISPANLNGNKINIYEEDANLLAKKIKSDIVYIDPPYKSRQYSRFYHVLENLARWEKPKLFGTARKPVADNMSEYCRSKAPEAFEKLIKDLNCKYIVVSYNNTYNSKSKSSKNKIEHEFIKNALNKRGKTVIFNTKHSYFNAGKTDFSNHQEFVFITKAGG
jgi:adenine-specific DNA-methyltransferase